MTTTPPLPKLPEPDGFRTRYQSEPGMIGHYPWTYADQRRRRIDRPNCESEDLFTADKLRAYALEALSQRGEAVPGAVWEDGGVSLIRRGTEDQRCKERGSLRLFTAPQPEQPDVLSLLLSDEVLEAATLAHEQSSCHDLIGPMSDALKAADERVRAMVPARPAKPVPMTTREAEELIGKYVSEGGHPMKLLRATEAFHHIKEQP